MLKITSAPSFFDTDICFADFLLKPFVDNFFLGRVFIHILQQLEVIGQIGGVSIKAVGEFYNGYNVAVAALASRITKG